MAEADAKNTYGKMSRTRHACQNLCQDRFEHPSTGPHLALAARWSHFRRRGSHSVQMVDLELNQKLKRSHTLRCHTTPLVFPAARDCLCQSQNAHRATPGAPAISVCMSPESASQGCCKCAFLYNGSWLSLPCKIWLVLALDATRGEARVAARF